MVKLVMEKNHMEKLYKSKNPLVKMVSVGRLDKIVESLPKTKNIKILDAGCGEGQLLLKIFNKGYNDIYGTDVTPVALESAKKRIPKTKFSLQDLKSLNFSDEYFDVVICTEVIEHIRDYNKVISELKRVLKKNGLLIITFPNEPLCVIMRIIFLRRPIPKDHISFFSVKKMKKLVGLKVKKKINLPYENFPDFLSLIHLLVFSK